MEQEMVKIKSELVAANQKISKQEDVIGNIRAVETNNLKQITDLGNQLRFHESII
jgi:hypothetical protein